MEAKQHTKPQDAPSEAVMEDGCVPACPKNKKRKKKIHRLSFTASPEFRGGGGGVISAGRACVCAEKHCMSSTQVCCGVSDGAGQTQVRGQTLT